MPWKTKTKSSHEEEQPDRTGPRRIKQNAENVCKQQSEKHPHDDQDGPKEDCPCLSPDAVAFVVPAVDKVNDRVDRAGREAEGIGDADGEGVIDQPGKQHPAVSVGCVGGNGGTWDRCQTAKRRTTIVPLYEYE